MVVIHRVLESLSIVGPDGQKRQARRSREESDLGLGTRRRTASRSERDHNRHAAVASSSAGRLCRRSMLTAEA